MLLMSLALTSPHLASWAFSSKERPPLVTGICFGAQGALCTSNKRSSDSLLRPQVSKLDLDLLKIVAMGDLLKHS